jgi:CDP-paratose 2-epimerase
MKIFISGICGFVGSSLARLMKDSFEGAEIFGVDNLSRSGSEMNRARLRELGVKLFHGDLRMTSDLDLLPQADWVIDAAANPSVLAGVDGRSSTRQVLEHNLWSVVNTLEYSGRCGAGTILLSSSRVYSIPALAALPLRLHENAFELEPGQPIPQGVSPSGITEEFSVKPPISLYGATKLTSEILALEYGSTLGFPVWINRCGVLAGAGQFGFAEQGIFSYWLHAHAGKRPLRYIGFGGRGWQVRDALHPEDLGQLVIQQIGTGSPNGANVLNVAGGIRNSISLAQLTKWCDQHFGIVCPEPDDRHRPFDVPWLVLDSDLARRQLGWTPRRNLESILEEIACHVRDHPGWLSQCGVA